MVQFLWVSLKKDLKPHLLVIDVWQDCRFIITVKRSWLCLRLRDPAKNFTSRPSFPLFKQVMYWILNLTTSSRNWRGSQVKRLPSCHSHSSHHPKSLSYWVGKSLKNILRSTWQIKRMALWLKSNVRIPRPISFLH